jgi:hypothetical protein
MRWLTDQFGIDRLLKARLVLPTEEFFPGPYERDLACASRLFERLCDYMGVDPKSLTLELCEDEAMPGAAGLYELRERSIVWIAQSQLREPKLLLATLAHELAHHLLLGGGLLTYDPVADAATRQQLACGRRLTPDMSDHEQVTDLLPVFLGVGIFAANATLRISSWTEGLTSYTSYSVQGYLPATIFGYALAIFAFLRREDSLDWVEHLRPDPAGSFRSGLRYLRKTGDSLCHPDTVQSTRTPVGPGELARRMGHRSATFRLSALWDVWEYQPSDLETLAAVQRCLDDSDADVRAAATRAVAVFGTAATGLIPRLVDMLEVDPSPEVALALGSIRALPEVVVPLLADRVGESWSGTYAEALIPYGPAAEGAAPKLLAALDQGLVTGDNNVPVILSVLRAIGGDTRARLRDYFRRDPDQLRAALAALKEQDGC